MPSCHSLPRSGWADVGTQGLLRVPSPAVRVQSKSRHWGRACKHQSPRAELEVCPAPLCVPLTAVASGETHCFSLVFQRCLFPSQVARDTQQLWHWPWFQELFNLVSYSVVRNVRHTRSVCGPAFIPRVRIQRGANTTRTCFGPLSTLWVAQGTKKSLPRKLSRLETPLLLCLYPAFVGLSSWSCQDLFNPVAAAWQGEPISKASSHSIPRCWHCSHSFC